MKRLRKGHFYKISDRGMVAIAEYMGQEPGWSCCVCGKGSNAKCFNVPYNTTIEEIRANGFYNEYETWGFGNEHFPAILEELGDIKHSK